MAQPAFVYAFDNLGPYRFTELCGELLASRYSGFMLGGEGADGGIDAELDKVLGIWPPEYEDTLLGEIIQPGETVVFQFKHKVSARVGQSQTRSQLLHLYTCKKNKKCELHSKLIQGKHPTTYILVTNLEVNSQFRNTFIDLCSVEQPEIKHYQVIGLDELVVWVKRNPQLQHVYFPTIFGPPRFELDIHLTTNRPEEARNDPPPSPEWDHILTVSILNTGVVPSYVEKILFRGIMNDKIIDFNTREKWDENGTTILKSDLGLKKNPDLGTPVEPGRKQTYYFHFSDFDFGNAGHMLPTDVIVSDEIEKEYSGIFPQEIKHRIQKYFVERRKDQK